MHSGDYLTREQLQQLADDMTMGDIWRAAKAAGDDRAELGMRSFYNAATRTGIAAGMDFEEFIDSVRQEDFTAVNTARTVGKGPTAP